MMLTAVTREVCENVEMAERMAVGCWSGVMLTAVTLEVCENVEMAEWMDAGLA